MAGRPRQALGAPSREQFHVWDLTLQNLPLQPSRNGFRVSLRQCGTIPLSDGGSSGREGKMEIFIYDARGRLAAEYGGTTEEIGTHYLTVDHLGSTRVITDESKAVIQCRDYLPFGGELLASAQNERNGIACYSADTGLRQKFTGKERDEESRLDYFGARYFSWAAGRFTSPDPSRLSAFIDSPQTWNMYAYASNNPLRFVDNNGMWSKPVHRKTIDSAFGFLSDAQRKILKDVSDHQDRLLGGHWNSVAFQHAMEGAGIEGSPEVLYRDFVAANLNEARKLQISFWGAGNPGISNDALAKFALALHAILDSTSPLHEGFQLWDVRRPAFWFKHAFFEGQMTPRQRSRAITEARDAFNQVFSRDYQIVDIPSFPRPLVPDVKSRVVCYSDDEEGGVCP